MRTRTLLLLAIGCGLAILLAGGFWLLRLLDDPEAPAALGVGESAQAGDLVATVVSADEVDGALVVAMTISGVDDVDVVDDFRLSVLEGLREPSAALARRVGADPCVAASIEERSCVLAFDVGDSQSRTRLLILRRGEDQRSWTLSTTGSDGG